MGPDEREYREEQTVKSMVKLWGIEPPSRKGVLYSCSTSTIVKSGTPGVLESGTSGRSSGDGNVPSLEEQPAKNVASQAHTVVCKTADMAFSVACDQT